MPELPDLQVFSRNLTKLFAGKKLKKVEIPYTKKLKIPAKKFKEALEGKTLKEVIRDGKELHFKFGSETTLGLHLMLRGELHEFEKTHSKKFPIIELYFSNSKGIVMTDYQGQATPTLNPKEGEGIDAMSDEVNFKFLKEKFQKSKAVVKNVLLDQKFVRGIGNAYVDEILWDARLSPFSTANKIPDGHIKALAKSIKKVLKEGEKAILKSNPDIITGEVRDFLKIHNHKKTHSPTGGEIIIDKSGSRKTYYTEEQKLFD
jgi:formamidopyrimidine-DNA glycosylase